MPRRWCNEAPKGALTEAGYAYDPALIPSDNLGNAIGCFAENADVYAQMSQVVMQRFQTTGAIPDVVEGPVAALERAWMTAPASFI